MTLFLSAFLIASSTAEAGFTANRTSGVNTASTDALEQHLEITPGTAVQPGTAIPTTTGSGTSLVVDLGRMPDTRTITDVIRIRNTDATARTIDLSVLAGLSSIVGLEYSDGTTSKSLTPGTTYQLRVRTTAANAGLQSSNYSMRDPAWASFLRRDLPLTTRQAPLAPSALTASTVAPPTVQVNLGWSASTSTGVGGYNVYRATAAAGPFARINGATVGGIAYADPTITAGTRYWYRTRAIATGVAPDLESPDSNTATARYPAAPTAVRIPAAAPRPLNYINFASRANVSAQADLPVSTEVGDIVTIRLSDGITTVSGSFSTVAAGAQTVTINGINATTLNDGAITMTAFATNTGNQGLVASAAATKDTVATLTGSQVAATALNPANVINLATRANVTGAITVPASSMATDTVSFRLTRGAATVTGVAAGAVGAGVVNVTGLNTNTGAWTDGAVVVAARVQDVAGNDSGFVNGTGATRDTALPAAPTAAAIGATAVNPANYINIATQAAAGVQVTAPAVAGGTLETRLTVGATSVTTTVGATGGTITVTVNATTLVDGNITVQARTVDSAGNPSAWFNGTAAIKDTVATTAPNFTILDFQNRIGRRDRVRGPNGSIAGLAQIRVFDYADSTMYPAGGGWDSANAAGNFGNINIADAGVPRTLGFEVRDAAWNYLPRICRVYTATGFGAATTCP